MKIIKKAYAKINLSLDVLSKREDNYHDLDMILQSVSLHDLITLEKNDSGKIVLTCDNPTLPTDDKNDAYKACSLMKERFHLNSGYRIHIEKRIPIEAGLGGGSADAAAVFHALNMIEGLHVPLELLKELGLMIGAELPYCLSSGLARVRGIGEKLDALPQRLPFFYTIVKPEASLKTKDVFQAYRVRENKKNYSASLYESLFRQDSKEILYSLMHNDLEERSAVLCADILRIKEELIDLGAGRVSMSGSGPSVFGVFLSLEDAKNAECRFRERGENAFAVHPVFN